jgi:L-alanine-DL-glutamate epimerase-like enolase superfamily enzyme
MTRITEVATHDLRARTSLTLAGSDAQHHDPGYSAAYVVLHTDGGHQGHGMTFTIGQGNDLCCAAIDALAPLVIGRRLDDIVDDMGAFWRSVTNHSQLRWLGPEKGVIHLATGAVVNAVWDLLAKVAGVLATASLFIYLTHWQVYPALEDAGHQWLALVASLTVGIAYAHVVRPVHQAVGRAVLGSR